MVPLLLQVQSCWLALAMVWRGEEGQQDPAYSSALLMRSA